MRNLAIRLVLWLCNRFDIAPLGEARLRMTADKKARSVQWETFAKEDGGLLDMLGMIRAEAFEAAAELDPKDTDKIYYWATADRNVRKLEARITSVIMSGEIETANIVAFERMNDAPVRKSVR